MRYSRAFTLLELIVVIFIVTIVGAMVFSSAMHDEKRENKVLDPSTLPSSFRKSFQGQGDVELFCIKKCQECFVLQNGQISSYDGGIKFGKDVELYKLDNNNHFVKLDELGRFKDKKLCLRYHLYPNGSTTQLVIKNSNGIFYLPSFFGEAKKVEDMDKAKELWIKEKYDLRDSGAFY